MTASPLSGKGIWIRRIVACEQGDLAAIVSRAQAAGFAHAILKIADGADAYNADPLTGNALELTRRLREAGLSVWGWHYLYGDKPRFKGRFQKDYHRLEADQAVQTANHLREAGLQGYVMSAEGEYERAPGRADQAAEFVARVHAGLGDFPLALASWKFPNSHKRFPWVEFRQQGVVDLPQVFWLGRHREAPAQLEKSFQQYATLKPRLPYVPVAPALFENGWRPSPADIEQFTARAMALGLPGFSLWAWDYLGLRGDETTGNPERLDFRAHWQVVAKTEWKETKNEETIVSIEPVPAERMPEAWAAELADLIADEIDIELPAFSVEPEPVIKEAQSLEPEASEPTEDLSAISFGLPSGPIPESAFTPEPFPAAESDEIRTRVQEVAERYADSFRDLRIAHRDQLIALGSQSLLGQAATDESLSITLTGQVVGEAHVGPPEVENQPPTPSPATELLPDELTAELESLTASEDDGDDVPDWLREAETAELTEDDAEPTRPFTPEAVALDLMPEELVAELESLTASEDDGDDVPDWLREAETAELTEDDAEPTRPFTPEAVALDLMPEELVAELESLTASEDDGDDVPDWLREAETAELTEDDAEPTRPFAPEAVAVDLMPEELVAELESLTASEDDGDDVPDWLHEAETAELTEDDAEPTRPFTPEAVALDLMPEELVAELESLTASEDDGDDVPDWLHEAETAELTEDDAEPTRPFAPEAVALDLMPDELVAELESLKTGEADDAEADADLPEWLRNFDIEAIETHLSEKEAEPTRPFTPEAEEFIFTLLPEALVAELESLTEGDDDEDDVDLPEWLRNFDIEALEARLSEEEAEPARPFTPEPEAGIGTLIASPVATTTTSPTISKLFGALSQGRLEEAFRLYAPAFTLVHGRQMARDRAGLRRFYLWLLPGLQRETLVVHSLHVNRLTVQARWSCQSLPGRMIEGVDTFHLNRQTPAQIVYHHTTLDFDPDST